MIEFNNIKVGILIPTFNRKIYLEKAVKSVCEQIYGNIEIIVIDNGSTDGTAEFMASRFDQRVRYVVNENNIGMIGSINKGINLFSDGVEWCTILSDDDILDKSFIALMIQFISANSVKAIAHSRRIFIDADGSKIRDARPAPLVESAFEYIFGRMRQERDTSLTGVFFSRRAFEKIGGYPRFSTGMATDDAFIFALSMKDSLYFNSDAVVFVRVHEQAESLRASETIKHFEALEEYAEYVRKVAGQSESYDREKKAVLEKSLRRYVKRLNGAILLRSVHFFHGEQDDNSALHLSQLYEVASRKNYFFSWYVRIGILAARYLNFSPKSSRLYRLVQRFLNAIKCIVE
jgi:glycosyltransferase involved in cell wall biosynthesis